MSSSAYDSSFFTALFLAMPVLALVLGVLGWISDQIKKETAAARKSRERARQEREAQLSRERAKSRYATNYAEYLPKWQAWRETVKVHEARQSAHEAELVAYDAWRSKFTAVWMVNRERGEKIAKLFEIIHENIDKRGRIELELFEPEHIKALFREAIAVAANTHPDLGLLSLVSPKVCYKEPPPQGGAYNPLTREELDTYNHAPAYGEAVKHRQVSPLISHNMPELAYLLDDARLEAVRDLLPSIPHLEGLGGTSRAWPKPPPDRPMRPTPPEGLIFYGQYEFEKKDAPPVPPDKVKWS